MNRRQALRVMAGGVALAALDACSSAARRSASTSPAAPPPASAAPAATPGAAGVTATTPSTAGVAAGAAPSTAAPPAGAVTTAGAASWKPGDPAAYVNHGPADRGPVALTFHFAGAPALATRLLDLLRGAGVHSTLFAIGDWITAHPALGHRAVDDGHELGNHTKSHLSMLQLDRARVHAEIAGGGAALVPFVGSIGTWFRPSGTDVPTAVILEEAGRVGYATSVGYDVDSRDYTEPGAAKVVDNVNPALHPGAIVSLHFGHTDTLAALPKILDRIAALGLRTATIGELLGRPAH